MSERFRPHPPRARSARCAVQLCAGLALVLAGCGSAAPKSSTHRPPDAATQSPISASQPALSTTRRTATARRPTPQGQPARPAPPRAACAAGEKRTLTGLCYSPAAQNRLVQKLGPCPAGQVVADNGACQPLTAKGPTSHPRGSIQGARPAAPSPGFDPVFH